jgi:ferredoxin-NADP reductase
MGRPRVSFFSDVERACVVESKTEVAAGVALVTLTAVNGRELPPWAPGSHVDLIVTTADGTVLERQYSLCGDPADRMRYSVAVLRETDGRGGSAAIHQVLSAGDALRIRGPRNHFTFDPRAGSPVLFLAGGIGITPLVSMSRAAAAAGVDYEIVYLGRSRSSMAFVRELEAEHGARLRVVARDEHDRVDLRGLVSALAPSARVYSCGPTALLESLDEAWAGRPAEQLHVERFEALEFGDPLWQDTFEVELAMTGVTLEVPLDRSILDVVEENGVLVVSSCRTGTCGTCQTPVLEGEIEHRDSVLTPGEQEDGDTMMICVSRANCPRLVLDL